MKTVRHTRMARFGSMAVAVGLTSVLAAGPSTATQDTSSRKSTPHGGRPFRIALTGANEVPANAHGNNDRGSAVITLNQGQGQVCWTFGALTLDAGESLPNNAHIHRAPVGAAGPVVVALFGAGNAPTAYPSPRKCVGASPVLIKEIRQNPSRFYVNMHNATHPSGVVRGQLG